MSWDVLFMILPSGVRAVDAIPSDYEPPPLGARAEVIARLVKHVPLIDFSDPAWGMLDGGSFSIEFNLGANETAASLMLHVRGGDPALGVVRDVAEALGCPALDCSTGELIDFDSAEAGEGFRKWRAFRDGVIGGRSK